MANEKHNSRYLPPGVERGDLPRQKVHGFIGAINYPAQVPAKIESFVFTFSLIEHLSPTHIVDYEVTTFGERARATMDRFLSGELREGMDVVVGGWVREIQKPSRRKGHSRTIRQLFPIGIVPPITPPNNREISHE